MKSNSVFSSHYGVFSGGGCACDSEWGILGVSATNATYKAGEEGTWEYQTHGDSDIYEFTGTTYLANYWSADKTTPTRTSKWTAPEAPKNRSN